MNDRPSDPLGNERSCSYAKVLLGKTSEFFVCFVYCFACHIFNLPCTFTLRTLEENDKDTCRHRVSLETTRREESPVPLSSVPPAPTAVPCPILHSAMVPGRRRGGGREGKRRAHLTLGATAKLSRRKVIPQWQHPDPRSCHPRPASSSPWTVVSEKP